MEKKTTSGIVTTNEDPAKVGRIKVTLAEVDGQEFPEWIEPVFVPGWFSPPEAGDEVDVEIPDGEDLAEFAHEVKYRGQVFSEGHGPPDELKQTQKKVHLRGYFTKAGHLLLFDDKKGQESVTIKEGTSGSAFTIKGASGGEELKLLEGKSGNSIAFTGQGQIKIENATAGSEIVLEPSGAITIKPGSPLTLDGDTIQLSSAPAVDFIIKGTTFNTSFGQYLTACANLASVNYAQYQALETASTGPLAPLAAAFGLLKTAWQNYGTAVSTLQGAASAWLSTKVKTG